jgi:hypothetical protein
MLFTGKEFNKKYSNYELYKVVSKDFTHNNFIYKDGLNIDTVPFNPSDECSVGGLYFTELYKLAYWINWGMYICKVTVPDDSLVYIEQNKFKVDKINLDLNNKVLIKDFYAWDDPYFCEIAVQQNHTALRFVRNQTEEICKIAIYKNSQSLQYVKEQTEDICKLAVQQNGNAIRFVKKKTFEIYKLSLYEICKLSVYENSNVFQYFKRLCSSIYKKFTINSFFRKV